MGFCGVQVSGRWIYAQAVPDTSLGHLLPGAYGHRIPQQPAQPNAVKPHRRLCPFSRSFTSLTSSTSFTSFTSFSESCHGLKRAHGRKTRIPLQFDRSRASIDAEGAGLIAPVEEVCSGAHRVVGVLGGVVVGKQALRLVVQRPRPSGAALRILAQPGQRPLQEPRHFRPHPVPINSCSVGLVSRSACADCS